MLFLRGEHEMGCCFLEEMHEMGCCFLEEIMGWDVVS